MEIVRAKMLVLSLEELIPGRRVMMREPMVTTFLQMSRAMALTLRNILKMKLKMIPRMILAPLLSDESRNEDLY